MAVKILFVCNDLRYFLDHRLFLATEMVRKGHEVALSVGVPDERLAARLPKAIRLEKLPIVMHRFSPASDLAATVKLARLATRLSPDLIHSITLKTNFLCSLALIWNRLFTRGRTRQGSTPGLVLTFPGLGKVYEPGRHVWSGIRRYLVSSVFRWTSRWLRSVATVENRADAAKLVAMNIFPRNRVRSIMGAGIALDRFEPAPRHGPPRVLFAARLLEDKGIRPFLAAARTLAEKYPEARFRVAGPIDPTDPRYVPAELITEAEKAGWIEYAGHVPSDGMPDLLRANDILCLPTMLREGFPRVVIEAAACGCAVVASDQPAISQLLKNGEHGWLVKDISAKTVTEALDDALRDITRTREIGNAAALHVRSSSVSDELVARAFHDVYVKLQH
ncbi:glycosyltransferase [Hoeflea sp.]|uniref:glycosyltransferase n=1 Tax=Hoeflea sp. TaxID=1940281 RepID=UPI003B518102